MSESEPVSGHWNVTLEPYPRIDDRIPLDQLLDRISEARVSLRGWDYPHMGDHHGAPVDRGITRVSDWHEYHERWVFMQTGYFGQRWRMREDGHQDRRWTLDFVNTIWSITEIWQFAKRLYGSDETVQEVALALKLDGLRRRRLTASPEYWLQQRSLPEEDTFSLTKRLSTAALRADAESPAIDWSQRLLHVMGVDISLEVVRDHQGRLLSRRHT